MKLLTSFWKDALPGAIAAGILAAAEHYFIGTISPAVPVTGLLAGGTVYAADHHVAPDGKAAPGVWGLLLLCCGLLSGLLLLSRTFNLIRTGIFVLLSLGYVLRFPGTSFRLQDHPWLRVLLICGGWGSIPLILADLPFSRELFGFLIGTTGLFFSGVLWSDLEDREDDVAGGRPTLIHSLSVRQTRVFLLLGYSLSIGGYLVAGLPILLAAPVLGLCLIPLLKSDSTPRFTDLLLLWPGLTVLITAGWNS